MAGRRPRPTKLKKLLGSYRADRANHQEPDPAVTLPTCPQVLGPNARREWRRMTKLLQDVGLVAQLDRTMLAGYCVTWENFLTAYEETKRTGLVVRGVHGNPVQSPFAAALERSIKHLRLLGAEFGCSPAARARLVAEPKEPVDPFKDYLDRSREAARAEEEEDDDEGEVMQ